MKNKRCNCKTGFKGGLTTLHTCVERESLLDEVVPVKHNNPPGTIVEGHKLKKIKKLQKKLGEIKRSDVRVSHGKVTHGLDDKCKSCDKAREEFEDFLYSKTIVDGADVENETTIDNGGD